MHNLSARYARDGYLSAVADEVDVEGIIPVRRGERTEQLVRFFMNGVSNSCPDFGALWIFYITRTF
jgi:hypothetical protein